MERNLASRCKAICTGIGRVSVYCTVHQIFSVQDWESERARHMVPDIEILEFVVERGEERRFG